MRKNVVIAVLVILLIGGAAAFFFKGSNPSQPNNSPAQSVADALKSAVTKAVSLTCTYTDPQGNQATAYIKNGAIRSDITAPNPENSSSVIVKDTTMYFWNGKKQGFMVPVNQDGPPPQGVPMDSLLQLQDMMQGVERSKDSCKPGLVGDELFVPPTDITFQDLSQMQQAPSGQGAYPSLDPTQMMHYMEEYQKSQSQ